MEQVAAADADMAWLIYDLQYQTTEERFTLDRHAVIYTKFDEALQEITQPRPGREADFLEVLQEKLDKKLEESTPPDTQSLDEIVGDA
jgi:hypothetical protein